MKLVDNWKDWWKMWTIRINIIFGISLNLLKNAIFPTNSEIFSNSLQILLIFNKAFTNSPKNISLSIAIFCNNSLQSFTFVQSHHSPT